MEHLAIGGVGFELTRFDDLFQVAGKERVSRALSSIGCAAVTASAVFPLPSLRPAAAPVAARFLPAVVAAALFVLLVLIEELALFPRIFVDYAEYGKRVPFIAPRLPIRR